MVRYVSPAPIMMAFLRALGWLGFDPVADVGAICLLALLGEVLRPRVVPVFAGC